MLQPNFKWKKEYPSNLGIDQQQKKKKKEKLILYDIIASSHHDAEMHGCMFHEPMENLVVCVFLNVLRIVAEINIICLEP